MLEPHELFSLVSGLEVSGGTEAEILAQIRRYQKTQAVKSARGRRDQEGEEDTGDNFEFCWEESRDVTRTPSRDIPGHSRPKTAKSPRSPKLDLGKSPKGSECSKSPRSPKSPDIVGFSDGDLRKLKLSLITEASDRQVSLV